MLSVFGAFNSRVLIEIPASVASKVFEGPFPGPPRLDVIEAVERDIAAIRDASSKVSKSDVPAMESLAASAVALAYEMASPFNSATSKSMCARVLLDTMDKLLELVPDGEQQGDALDELASRRAERIAGGAAASD